jgi:hypothetical protein
MQMMGQCHALKLARSASLLAAKKPSVIIRYEVKLTLAPPGCCGEDKSSCPFRESNTGRRVCNQSIYYLALMEENAMMKCVSILQGNKIFYIASLQQNLYLANNVTLANISSVYQPK